MKAIVQTIELGQEAMLITVEFQDDTGAPITDDSGVSITRKFQFTGVGSLTLEQIQTQAQEHAERIQKLLNINAVKTNYIGIDLLA